MTQDSSCAKESHKDETSDLDLELDSLRRKLESVSTLVVMNQLIIYLDFCNNCQCFLLFTRLTRSLKILKERCRCFGPGGPQPTSEFVLRAPDSGW